MIIQGLIFSIFWIQVYGTCVDNNTLCPTWVTAGFCNNSYYSCQNMLDYCSFSCDVASCNPQTTCNLAAPPLGGSDAPPSAALGCTDTDTMCADWSSAGFCNNTYYTCDQKQQYCAGTCNIGGCNPQTMCLGGNPPVNEDPSACPPDNNTMCSTWVSSGFCTSSYYNCSIQLSYCATTCNILSCNGDTPTPCVIGEDVTVPPAGVPVSNGQCVDADTNCINWKANGFCQNNFYTCDYKIQYCAASCNIQTCSPAYAACSGSTGCADLSPRCAAWASTGFCQNPFYDNSYRCNYCPSTCGLCGQCTPAASPPPPPAGTTIVAPPPAGTTAAGAPPPATKRGGGGNPPGGTTGAPPAPGATTEAGAPPPATKRGGGGNPPGGTTGAPPAPGGTTAAGAPPPATKRGGGGNPPAGTTVAPPAGTTAGAPPATKRGGGGNPPAGTTGAPPAGTTAGAPAPAPTTKKSRGR